MYFTDKKMAEIEDQIYTLTEKNMKGERGEKLDPRQKAEKTVAKNIEYRYQADIGNRLKECREQRGLTQDKMVEDFYPLAPMTKSGYSRIETGENQISLALLVMIAERWDIDLHWLLTGESRDRPTLPFEVRNAMQIIADYCSLAP